MILKSVFTGIRLSFKTKRMIALFYLSNLIFGISLMIPLRFLLERMVGKSTMGNNLVSGTDMDFVFEFFTVNQNAITAERGLILIVPIIFWLFGLFLSGGAFSTFIHKQKYESSYFWGESAKYFGRYFRLFLFSIPIFILFYCLQYLETAVQYLIYGKDPYQYVIYWGGWIKIAIGYVGLLIAYLVFDYARIYIVMFDVRGARKAVWHGFKFVFKHFPKTFSIAFIYFVLGISFLLLYNLISDSISDRNLFFILTLIIIQQFYMLTRTVIRLALYGGQSFYFKYFNTIETEESTI
jgi:hypothetical protein